MFDIKRKQPAVVNFSEVGLLETFEHLGVLYLKVPDVAWHDKMCNALRLNIEFPGYDHIKEDAEATPIDMTMIEDYME